MYLRKHRSALLKAVVKLNNCDLTLFTFNIHLSEILPFVTQMRFGVTVVRLLGQNYSVHCDQT